jgi:outer membrane protein
MHKIQAITAVFVSAALVASAGAAMAQGARPAAAPAAAASAGVPPGPAIPNVCIFSQQAAIGTSAVGKYVVSRLQQIQAQAQAELQGEETTLQTDAKAYAGQRASLSTDVQQQRERALQERAQALQQKAQLRGREIEATQQKAISRVVSEYDPLVISVMKTRNCSVVFDGQAVLAFNPGMDLTPDVVRQLDAKITQFPFEREHLDTGAAAAPAAAGAKR